MPEAMNAPVTNTSHLNPRHQKILFTFAWYNVYLCHFIFGKESEQHVD